MNTYDPALQISHMDNGEQQNNGDYYEVGDKFNEYEDDRFDGVLPKWVVADESNSIAPTPNYVPESGSSDELLTEKEIVIIEADVSRQKIRDKEFLTWIKWGVAIGGAGLVASFFWNMGEK